VALKASWKSSRSTLRELRGSARRPAKTPLRQPANQSWFSIRVELIEGRGENYWPRPGRLIAAAPTHSFAQLATAIDNAFARWDISHLHQFQLSNGMKIGRPDPDFDEDELVVDESRTRLSRLELAQQFAYVFDFGDYWAHLCTVDSSLLRSPKLGRTDLGWRPSQMCVRIPTSRHPPTAERPYSGSSWRPSNSKVGMRPVVWPVVLQPSDEIETLFLLRRARDPH
jgi:hypothetical protein